jgi:hypothetical protein
MYKNEAFGVQKNNCVALSVVFCLGKMEANKTTSLEVNVYCQRPPTALKFYVLPLPRFE